jgi:hypothetical protein
METNIPNKIAEARLTESCDPDTLQLFTLANKCGVTRAEIDFSGSGDSGEVNDSVLYRGDEYVKDHHDEDVGKLDSLLNAYFHEHLSDRIGWDWYNNEGGGGQVTIHFTTGQIEISGYYYTQCDADGETFNIFETEEAE